jgi:hypothetical protein
VQGAIIGLGGGFFITLLTGSGRLTIIGSIFLGVGSLTSIIGYISSSEDSGSLINFSSLSLSSSKTPYHTGFLTGAFFFFFFLGTTGPTGKLVV